MGGCDFGYSSIRIDVEYSRSPGCDYGGHSRDYGGGLCRVEATFG
jgi:hypothetical protein